MCGILGTTDLSISITSMQLALKEILRRGPDNQELIKNEKVYFGHTRLAIVDLEQRSNQPFSYKHKGRNILTTFNGEIFNYLEIKADLINKGYIFHTSSDTEVVCASYCEFGLECFDLFEGMWAVAIHDESNLFLSRDRAGKKPLYYSHINNGHLFFGSSLKSVSILSEQRKVNTQGIELYFALGFLPKNYSIIENIAKVEPGNICHFLLQSESCVLKNITYSTFNPLHKIKGLSVKKLIHEAIKIRLPNDVAVTTLMSGGVDSTIITSIINKLRPNVEAYFVDFKDESFSERKWAHYLAKRNAINLNTYVMTPEELTVAFADYYAVYEEPFADYSGIPSIAIFKEVAKKYKVVLTGDGGDELFYGYPHYYKKLILYSFFRILKLFRNSRFLPVSIKTIVSGNIKEFESNYLKNHGIVTPFAAALINTNFNKNIFKSSSFIRGIMEYDRNFYNWPEKYLVKTDRASMFSGVEVRSPFMDESLMLKLKNVSSIFLFTPYCNKLFLKLSFFNKFGLKYFMARKKGFTPPIDKLRIANFIEVDFLELKLYLKNNCANIHNLIAKLEFQNIQKDKILFDRFFFFNEWKKNNDIK